MYGVETFVHPEYQSLGVGSKLMDARFNLLRRLNLRGMVAGSLFVGYEQVADQMSQDQYVREVVEGKHFDPNSEQTDQERASKSENLIPNYTEDSRTQDYAAAIVWVNPDYTPRVVHFPAKAAPAKAGQRPSLAAPGS